MGRVLVVGGSSEYAGAAYLAAIAALRSGAESVVVMAPEKVAWALNALSPDLMTRKLKGEYLSLAHEKTILAQAKTADVLLFGSGSGMRAQTTSLMKALARWKGRKVLEADALKALRAGRMENAILTPNEAEWDILSRRNDTRSLLEKNVIVKKSARTEILSGKKRIRLGRVYPGLRVAGAGDVLAGMCAGFLAAGANLEEAAKRAARLGMEIADAIEKRKKIRHFLASDLLAEIRKARRI